MIPSSAKILTVAELLAKRDAWREAGLTVVFTNGCFDLLHAGHVGYMEDAKGLGDILVVGLNSDASVRRLKGPKRPINPQDDRATVLAGLGAVDGVVIFDTDTPSDLIAALQPDIHTKGGDYVPAQMPEFPIVTAYGGQVVILPFRPGRSSSAILARCQAPE